MTPELLTPPGGWQTPGSCRLPPLTRADMSRSQRLFVASINKVGKLEASNLFMLLLRNMRLFVSWLMFAMRLMPYGQIKRRDTELVILRVGWNCRCRYEWGQHVDIGLRHGVTMEDIQQIPLGAEGNWLPHEKALMQACDEFHHDRLIATPTWQVLEAHYGPRLMLEVVMLIGHYEMLAGVLNSTGITLDPSLEAVLSRATRMPVAQIKGAAT